MVEKIKTFYGQKLTHKRMYNPVFIKLIITNNATHFIYKNLLSIRIVFNIYKMKKYHLYIFEAYIFMAKVRINMLINIKQVLIIY